MPKMASLRPFQPGEYIDNGDGSFSTERTVTIEWPGGFANVPTLWMSPSGQALDLAFNEEIVRRAAENYVSEMGGKFDVFPTVDEAVAAAKARSEGGGAFHGQVPEELKRLGGLGGLGGMPR